MIIATELNFEAEVLPASLTTPVLVDFWAPWCTPCKTLIPVLEKLEAEYEGRFILAKVNVDEQPGLAAMFGVRSVPACMLLKEGRTIDGFMVALPEVQVREFLDKHLQPAAPAAQPELADDVLDDDEILERLQNVLAAEPENDNARFDYVKLLLQLGRMEEAQAAFVPAAAKMAAVRKFDSLHRWLQALQAQQQAPADMAALDAAIAETEKPTLIIGKTIMGKGALKADGTSFEKMVSTHGQPLTDAGANIEATIKNLGGNPAEPFAIFNDVAEYYKIQMAKKAEFAKIKKAEEAKWASQNPLLAAKLKKFLNKSEISFDFSKVEQKANQATRVASSTILGECASQIENMVVMSADLANSDKTDGFLKKSKPFAKGDFSGAFLQAGVAELTMASIANGMRNFINSFFYFSLNVRNIDRFAFHF